MICLNGPICTSRINSGLIFVSLMTNGMSWFKFARISSGLLCAAEVNVDIACLRISISESPSAVLSISTSEFLRTASNASLSSGRVYRNAWTAMALRTGELWRNRASSFGMYVLGSMITRRPTHSAQTALLSSVPLAARIWSQMGPENSPMSMDASAAW
jgi:hypothetical protein